MTNHKRLPNGLTPKQNNFVAKILEKIAKDGSFKATDIAMEVYDAKDRRVATAIASENLTKPIIKETIEDALSAVGMSITENLEEMNKIAKSVPEKWTVEAKLKANVELLKLRGAYPNNPKGNRSIKSVTRTLTYDEALKKISINQKEVNTITQEIDNL